MTLLRATGASAAALAVLLLSACAPTDSGDDAAAPASSASCTPEGLRTRTAGTLTVGTDKPAYPPWFQDDEPSNGKGFESAVAYAVADELGYPKDKVTWVTASFNSVIQPGPKPFDVDINQFSITAERKKAVDFSSGYYDVAQSVVTVAGSKAANARSLADLQGLKLGAQVGTTSLKAIEDIIKPSGTPQVFDDNDKAKLALSNGTVDAIVVDLPTGLYLTAADLKDGKLIGQLPPTSTATEQFGMALEQGSPLTSCVSTAVDTLRSNGTLAKLQTQWLTESAGAPVLS